MEYANACSNLHYTLKIADRVFCRARAVGANLTIDEIVKAKDYALAEVARPAFGQYGLWITVGFAIVATVSGLIASVFAVSRMLAMLTDMKLVPHSHHFGCGRAGCIPVGESAK